MNKYLAFLITLFFSLSIQAQISLIDSLRNEVSNVNDSIKCTIFHDLSLAFIRVNIDSAQYYASKNYNLSIQNNYEIGKALSLENFGIIKNVLGDLDSSDYYFNKAYLIYKNKKIVNGQTTCMGWLSSNQSIRGNYKESITLLKSCVDLKIQSNDTINLHQFYQNIGVDNHLMGNFDEAESYYFKAILFSEKVNDSISLGYIYGNLGEINISKSNYDSALNLIMTSQKFNESTGNINGIANNYFKIGNIYVIQKKYKLALEYYKKAKNKFEELNYKTGIASTLFDMGRVYMSEKLYDTAFVYYNKAYALANENQELDLIANIESDLALVSLYQKDLYAAENYILKSLKNGKILNDKEQKIKSNIVYGKILFEQQKYSEARSAFETAEKLNKEINNLSFYTDIYKNLSSIYERQNNLKKSINYYKKYTSVNDSLNAQLYQEQFIEIQTKYQTAQKEKENQQLQFENDLQKEENAKIRSQNLFILTSSVFVAILLLVSFIIFRTYQKNKFNKRLLQEIDEQNDLISQNLHDGMSGYLHALKNRLEFKQEKSQDLQQEIDIIHRSQKELRFLMKQLSAPYYKNKNFDLSKELDELNHFYETSSMFKIDSYFDQNIIWKNISYENKLHIYKLAQELLANVKKHSGAQHISLQLIKDKNNLIMSMEDDGKGFNKDESASGYGLKNIEKRIKDLKGNLNIDSKPGEGTFISFSVPVLT